MFCDSINLKCTGDLHVFEFVHSGPGVAGANLSEGLILLTASLHVLLVQKIRRRELAVVLDCCQLRSQFLVSGSRRGEERDHNYKRNRITMTTAIEITDTARNDYHAVMYI